MPPTFKCTHTKQTKAQIHLDAEPAQNNKHIQAEKSDLPVKPIKLKLKSADAGLKGMQTKLSCFVIICFIVKTGKCAKQFCV